MLELETSRLRLRPFTSADLDSLAALFSDPEVMQYVRADTGKAVSREQTAVILDKYIDYWRQHGIGRLVMDHKANQKMIGFCGLRWFEPEQQPEIVYLLAREYWGRGLATEAARACLRYGFEQKGYDRIIGVTLRANVASWRVMEKTGMKFEADAEYYDVECVRYAIKRDKFQLDDSLYVLRLI